MSFYDNKYYKTSKRSNQINKYVDITKDLLDEGLRPPAELIQPTYMDQQNVQR